MRPDAIVVRPEPGCSATVSAARQLGLTLQSFPLFDIRPLDWVAPDPGTIDAMLFGSANALRHGGALLAAFKGKPAYCVGQATAQAAREAGFIVAEAGEGGLQRVIDGIPGPMRLLRVSGAEHVPLSCPSGVQVATVIAYESIARPMPDSMQELLANGSCVLLHSAAAAAHLAKECDRLRLARSSIGLLVLGPRIAKAAGDGWAFLRIAESPKDGVLLELLDELCHETTKHNRRGSRPGAPDGS